MVVIDSYSAAINTAISVMARHPSSTTYASARGQTFRPSASYRLTSIKFQLRRTTGIPDGTIKAYLYAHTGTFGSNGVPTGEALAESTNSINAADLLSGSYTEYTFTFDGSFILEANTAYCIMVYSLDCTNWGGTNYVRMAGNDSGAHEGNGFRFRSNIWQAMTTWESLFEVNGDLYVSPIGSGEGLCWVS